MHFETSVEDKELPTVLREFVRIAGWSNWSKRLAWLDKEVRRETGVRHFWAERCALELTFCSAWRRHRTRRRLGRANAMEPEEIRFLSFATAVVRCHEKPGQSGRNRLKGMLRERLTGTTDWDP